MLMKYHDHHRHILGIVYTPEGVRRRVLPLPVTFGEHFFDSRESAVEYARRELDGESRSPPQLAFQIRMTELSP